MFLGISLGDITGVGPEVALKAVAAEAGSDDTKYLFIGDQKILQQLNDNSPLQLPLREFSGYKDSGRFFAAHPLAEPLPEHLPAGSPPAANAAVAALRDGGQRCLRGELDALVTAPVNKEAIIRAGHKFVGQTEFLSDLAATNRTARSWLGTAEPGRGVRVPLATVHISTKPAPENLTAE